MAAGTSRSADEDGAAAPAERKATGRRPEAVKDSGSASASRSAGALAGSFSRSQASLRAILRRLRNGKRPARAPALRDYAHRSVKFTAPGRRRYGVKPNAVGVAVLVVVSLALPARAQLLGHGLGGVTLPALGLPTVRGLTSEVTAGVTGALDPQQLLQLRQNRLGELVRAHPRELELDEAGNVVVRGAVLAVNPSSQALAQARAEGFATDDGEPEPGLDVRIVRLRAPGNISARAALKRLRTLDPGGAYDFDSLYAPSGGARTASTGGVGGGAVGVADVKIGLIDTGVNTSHPAFAAARIEQKGFAPGGVVPAAHGTATASLMVGEGPGLRGSDPGGALIAADVYGDGPTGGAGDMLVRALAWTAAHGARVVNMSLVGPPNLALAAAVRATLARGILIVAPVGNDGPAAPPAYPAAYPGVVAVTGVDARGRVLIEAGRGPHLDFAAQGADLKAAGLAGGWVSVRGTSFAAPIVAGRLATAEAAGAADPDAAQAALAASARKGGAYGRGLVTAQAQTAAR
jgi:hypothetical protein